VGFRDFASGPEVTPLPPTPGLPAFALSPFPRSGPNAVLTAPPPFFIRLGMMFFSCKRSSPLVNFCFGPLGLRVYDFFFKGRVGSRRCHHDGTGARSCFFGPCSLFHPGEICCIAVGLLGCASFRCLANVFSFCEQTIEVLLWPPLRYVACFLKLDVLAYCRSLPNNRFF